MSEGLILTVEDESSIADSVSYSLGQQGFRTSVVATGLAALKAIQAESPALVILDVGLPDRSGFEVCKEIRRTNDIPIIFLTARGEEIDRVLGLEIGGDDYILKPFSQRELTARVKALLRRTSADPKVRPSLNQNFIVDEERRRILFKGQPLDLSRYEFLMFRVLLKRPGRVFSREELMNLVWESPEMSLERTVDTHIKLIRAKLRQVDSSDDSIVTHRGFGYSLKEQ